VRRNSSDDATGRGGGSLAAGILCALAVSTANAWVLLVEVVRDARYQPIEGAP
jgi:hypothetical protein